MQKLLFCVLVGLLATRLSAQDFKFNIDLNLKGIRLYISAPQVSKNIMPEPLAWGVGLSRVGFPFDCLNSEL